MVKPPPLSEISNKKIRRLELSYRKAILTFMKCPAKRGFLNIQPEIRYFSILRLLSNAVSLKRDLIVIIHHMTVVQCMADLMLEYVCNYDCVQTIKSHYTYLSYDYGAIVG